MDAWLSIRVLEVADVAEVEIIDQDAAFGDMAEKAAVDAGLVHLEQKEVVLALGEGDDVAAPFFAKKEGVEAYLAACEDVETHL